MAKSRLLDQFEAKGRIPICDLPSAPEVQLCLGDVEPVAEVQCRFIVGASNDLS